MAVVGFFHFDEDHQHGFDELNAHLFVDEFFLMLIESNHGAETEILVEDGKDEKH